MNPQENTFAIHRAKLLGTEGMWDDLRFPAQGINPPGNASDPTVDDDGSLLFSGTADNIIAGIAQLPHSWWTGSLIAPHLHLRFPTSAVKNTRWKFEYDRASVGDDFESGDKVYANSETITIPNAENVDKHAVASFSRIDMTGYRDSCIIMWKITRLANSDPLDNDTNDAKLLEFDIHYQKAKWGTFPEFPGA